MEKVGVMFGNPETTPWVTMPLKNYASQRVELRQAATIKDGEDALGFEIKAKIVKNCLAAPLVTANFELHFATGICNESELLTLSLEAGVLTKRGSRHFFGEELLGMSRSEALRQLAEDASLSTRFRDSIIERLQA